MAYILGNRSWKQLIGVHPNLGFMASEAIQITKQDFTVFEGIRTIERQKEMVASGASKTMDSYHLYGLAIDLIPWIDGAPRWEEEPLKKIVDACKQVIRTHGLGIDHGMDLWGWDGWHWQMTGLKDKYDIRQIGVVPSAPAPQEARSETEQMADALALLIKKIAAS